MLLWYLNPLLHIRLNAMLDPGDSKKLFRGGEPAMQVLVQLHPTLPVLA